MDILSQAARIAAPPDDDGLDAEVARLRAQVAWLQAERAALSWAIGHDELTGLANRRLLNALGPTLLRESRQCAVVVLDLNGFKPINDRYGHAVGDDVLCTVARRLSRCLEDDDLAVRLSGDEFAAVLPDRYRADRGPAGRDWASRVAVMSDTIAEPMTIGGYWLCVTASIGVATLDDESPSIAELIRRADLAMYHAKANRFRSHVLWNAHLPTVGTQRAGGRHRPAAQRPGG